MTPAGSLDLTNEFASVNVAMDATSNSVRLRLQDHNSGHVVYLDPLELASLTTVAHAELGRFLDPSENGWPRISAPAPSRNREDDDG